MNKPLPIRQLVIKLLADKIRVVKDSNIDSAKKRRIIDVIDNTLLTIKYKQLKLY